MKKRLLSLRFRSMGAVLLVFLTMAVILFAERLGVQYVLNLPHVNLLDADVSITAKEAAQELPTTCLLLLDSENPSTMMALPQFQQILLDMKVGYEQVDVTLEDIPDFEAFDTVIVLMTDVSVMGEEVLTLSRWVEQGGQVLMPMSMEKESYLSLIEQKMGIISSSYSYTVVENICFREGFLIGGSGRSFSFSDPFDSAWEVALDEESEVYAWVDNEYRQPLVWSRTYGQGKFVVVNIGIYEKANRGIYAAAYSLLQDACAWPVINGSAFYLDDFPSPVPSGNGAYVKRDYGMSIADFYINVWWPDMLQMAEKHGVRYTGVVIENYGDEVDGSVYEQTITRPYQYYGNMLLRSRGEIGYHGYNHQPLSLGNTDYAGELPYNTWESYEAMHAAVSELVRFVDEMYPEVEKGVYVPPSNVLSAEGRAMLKNDFPHIRTIASCFFPGEHGYDQEFEVAEDGLIEQPRVISGCILDEYMRLGALSELNMHFINTHFMHPDDLLDEDRGAAIGWETLKGRLAEYMSWLYDSAPMIRNMTGTELSGAIQRYAALTVDMQISEGEILLRLGHRYDEAWLLVRINRGVPRTVTGGTLTPVTGNLYLLNAVEDEVRIALDQEEVRP